MNQYKVGDYVILSFGIKRVAKVTGFYFPYSTPNSDYVANIQYGIQFQDGKYSEVTFNEIERLASDKEMFSFLMEM